MNRHPIALLLAGTIPFLFSSPLSAQGPAFTSPGQSSYSITGQANRFSNEFNPAIGFAIDAFGDFVDTDRGKDGVDLVLRILEFNASAYIDPNAWAYVAIVAEELEEIAVEEAAVEYIGFENNSTIRAGRFFVDFGKQMQTHLEELRTLERPLVLREYLGEELGGTGAQWDHWLALADDMPLRFSVGVFADLLGESEIEDAPTPEALDRKDFDELSFSARVTAMKELGDSSTLQLGGSARIVPEFSFEFADVEAPGQMNQVYGADLTFGWNSDTGNEAFLAGGEALMADGALAATIDDPLNPTAITVVDDTAFGFYVFSDLRWTPRSSAGVQWSWIERPEDPSAETSELDAYYTLHMTELRRLRFGATYTDGEADELRFYVQFTNFFGTHAHGLNW